MGLMNNNPRLIEDLKWDIILIPELGHFLSFP